MSKITKGNVINTQTQMPEAMKMYREHGYHEGGCGDFYGHFEEMLGDDEITAGEEGFMLGYESDFEE